MGVDTLGGKFDTRIIKNIQIRTAEGGAVNTIYPYVSVGRFIGDFLDTPQSALQAPYHLYDADTESEDFKTKVKDAEKYAKSIQEKWNTLEDEFVAVHSMIHPYALIRLAGTTGNTVTSPVDNGGRRWYEVDGTKESGHYSKIPTTGAIINWSNQDTRGRFPYAFTDFVFCKNWNKIQNNRMITLRRYPLPITDNVEPADFISENVGTDNAESHPANKPFAPIATAVTYFGGDSGNNLKELLTFSLGYNWEDATADVWDTNSEQMDGENLTGPGAGSHLTKGLSTISNMLGVFGEFKAQTEGKSGINPMNAAGLPPDPYSSGIYENRIIGPVNSITSVKKRKRGLKFEHDSLSIKFEYMSRPIANINNKAILLDLMSNILLMTSGSATFFGGARKYRNPHPKIYPWRDYDSMNALYKGKIFGKNGAFRKIVSNAFSSENRSFAENYFGRMWDDFTDAAANFINGITERIAGVSLFDVKNTTGNTLKNGAKDVTNTVNKVVATHLLKGATIPYLNNAHALLTGDPVGDWHLTIGNPLNPIVMIGNLIVEDCKFEFSEELGPDDFPIGFTATITLKHGMGRDRDAVESMFNRGEGRIYSLPDALKTSADGETRVDNVTGLTAEDLKNNKNAASTRTTVQNAYLLQNEGSFGITAITDKKLANTGDTFKGTRNAYNLNYSTLCNNSAANNATYITQAFHTHMCL